MENCLEIFYLYNAKKKQQRCHKLIETPKMKIQTDHLSITRLYESVEGENDKRSMKITRVNEIQHQSWQLFRNKVLSLTKAKKDRN